MVQVIARKLQVVALALLAGCATVATPTENPRRVWCDHNQPRRDATAETPRAELDEINKHNALGVRWCGWQP